MKLPLPQLRQFRIPASILALSFLVSQSLFANDVTWTSVASGNWSVGTNWSTSPATPVDGDAIFFNLADGAASFTTGMDLGGGTFGVGEINLANGTGANSVTIVAGALTGGSAAANQAATLRLGAGGITVSPGSTTSGSAYLQFGSNFAMPTNVLTVQTTGNQSWESSGIGFNNGRIIFQANLAGSGSILVRGGALVGGGPVQFEGGSSNGFSGNFILNSGAIRLLSNSQIDRLGPNALTIQTGSPGAGIPTLNFGGMVFANTSLTFSNAIVFEDTGTAAPVISLDPNGTPTGTNSFNLTGAWSGVLNDSVTLSSNTTGVTVRLQGNNSAVTAPLKTGGIQNASTIFFRSGIFSVENANSLGAGNSLSVAIGQSGADSNNFNALSQTLNTNNGINIASNIWVNQNFRGTADMARGAIVTLGLNGPGAASFTGAVNLESIPMYSA